MGKYPCIRKNCMLKQRNGRGGHYWQYCLNDFPFKPFDENKCPEYIDKTKAEALKEK